MIEVKYEDVLFETEGALIHDVYPGFKQDYLVVHSLLRKYKPKTIFEVGTNIGSGVNVMATALPDAKIYSLDLDYETMKLNSKQYPIGPKGEDRVGSATKVPYVQLRGDSMKFNFSEYACEAYYLDGEHSETNVFHETSEIIKCDPDIVILHDTDMPEVFKGMVEAINKWNNSPLCCGMKQREIYRVLGTRISFILRK